MKKIAFFLIALTLLSYNTQAQSKKDIKKKTFLATELLANNRYESADKLFSELLQSDKNNLDLIFYSGVCKLNLNKENEAINLFSKIINSYKKNKEESSFTKEAYFEKSKAYHNLYQFDEEIATLNELNTFELSDKEKNKISASIKGAESAKKLFFDFKPIIITRLAILNSGYDDHTPIPTANGSKLYFTSKRQGGISGKTISNEGKYYEDIWSWVEGSKPINIGEPVNTKEHDATGGLSLDGKTLFIYKALENKRGDLYSSILDKDGEWSKPVSLGKNINKRKSIERHAALSPDGKKLYISSDRKGGKGGRDIWVSELQDNNKWGKPSSLNINTEYNEESPYMLSDGKTFYFSSNNKNGMGGYDIYKCTLQDDGTYSTPINIGFPINTVEDDVFFFPLSDEKVAYFTRRKSDNAEIYKTMFPDNTIIVNSNIKGTEVDTTYKINSKILVIDVNSIDIPDFYSLNLEKGNYNTVVTNDKDYKFYYEADNYVFDTKDIKQQDMMGLEKIKRNPILVKIEDGKTEKFKNLNFENNSSKFSPFVNSELDLIAENLQKYDNLVVNFSGQKNTISKERKDNAINYLINKGISSDKIFVNLSKREIPENNLEYTIYDIAKANEIIAENKKEEEIAKNKEVSIEIENIFFNFDKFKMQVTANNKLDLLAKYLSENSSAKISITGYTDAVGSKAYNNKLSFKRANTIKDYLTEKGANENQVTTFAYGEDNPVTFNKKNGRYFELSKKFNRRVEFYVLSQGTPKLKIIQFKNVPNEYKEKNYVENYKK